MSMSNPYSDPISDFVIGQLAARDEKKKAQQNAAPTPGFQNDLLPMGGIEQYRKDQTFPNFEALLGPFMKATGYDEKTARALLANYASSGGGAQIVLGADVSGATQLDPNNLPGQLGQLGAAPGGPQVPTGAPAPSAPGMPSAQAASDGSGGPAPNPVPSPPQSNNPPGSTMTGSPAGPVNAYLPSTTPGSPLGQSEQSEPAPDSEAPPDSETPPGGAAPTPVLDTSGNAPDTGWSATVAPETWGDLATNPVQAARVLMQQQGLDPNSTNPIIQARLKEAARSRGIYQLLYGATGAAGGFDTGNFLDWFQNYMQNEATPGAAPTLTAQQATQLLTQAMQSATDPNNPWAKMLLNISDVDPATGVGYAPSPGDQSSALNQLLVSALGGILDPAYVQALTENTQRQEQNYRTNVYDTTSGQAPDANFLDYYLKNSPLTRLAGG